MRKEVNTTDSKVTSLDRILNPSGRIHVLDAIADLKKLNRGFSYKLNCLLFWKKVVSYRHRKALEFNRHEISHVWAHALNDLQEEIDRMESYLEQSEPISRWLTSENRDMDLECGIISSNRDQEIHHERQEENVSVSKDLAEFTESLIEKTCNPVSLRRLRTNLDTARGRRKSLYFKDYCVLRNMITHKMFTEGYINEKCLSNGFWRFVEPTF